MTAVDELKKNGMMEHLLSSLEAGKDIGHYGRLVVVMVARNFMSEEELIGLLQQDPDCSEEKARSLVEQVQARGYNPPKRERILQWMEKQDFPICPGSESPDACNVYKDLEFPEEIYNKISSYYETQAHA